jgi:peptidoglycan/LPS O-acetylase OafA/YrhL
VASLKDRIQNYATDQGVSVKFVAGSSLAAFAVLVFALFIPRIWAISSNPADDSNLTENAPLIMGVACMVTGLLIGAIMRSVIAAEKRITQETATGALALLTGAAVLGLFKFLQGDAATPLAEYWYYPIGVALGFFAISIAPGRSSMWHNVSRRQNDSQAAVETSASKKAGTDSRTED